MLQVLTGIGITDKPDIRFRQLVFTPERGFATNGDKYRTAVQGYYENFLIDGQFDVTYKKRFNYVHDVVAEAEKAVLLIIAE